jgi:hypothetical protein
MEYRGDLPFRVAGGSPRAQVAGKTSSGLSSRQSGIRYGSSGSGTGAGNEVQRCKCGCAACKSGRQINGPEPGPAPELLNPGPDGRDPGPENEFDTAMS